MLCAGQKEDMDISSTSSSFSFSDVGQLCQFTIATDNFLCFTTQHYATVIYAMTVSVYCLSVCPFVCLSQACVLSKQQKVSHK